VADLLLRPTPADAIDRARQHDPDLPPVGQVRWTPKLKAAVVQAIFHRLLTIEQAVDAYGLSDEELGYWMVGYRKHGRVGVSVSKPRFVRERLRHA
jgi:transposase-like protein